MSDAGRGRRRRGRRDRPPSTGDGVDVGSVLFVVGAVALTSCVVLFARDPVATGYERTVYESLPVGYWVTLVTGLVVGQVLVLRSAFADRPTTDWAKGAVLLGVALCLLVFLPTLRFEQYALGRADSLTFVGMTRHIVETGGVAADNYYPAVHLLAATLSYATGLPVTRVASFVPAFLSLFYVATTLALCALLFEERRVVLFVLPTIALPLLAYEHLMFAPSVAGFLLTPFLLVALYRARDPAYHPWATGLLLGALCTLVFFHPLTTAFLLVLFAALRLPDYLAGGVRGDERGGRDLPGGRDGRGGHDHAPPGRPVWGFVAIGFVLFYTWYFSFASIVGSTVSLLARLVTTGGVASSEYSTASGVFGRTTPRLADVLLTGVFTYGELLLLLGLGGVSGAYLLVRWRRTPSAVPAVGPALVGVFALFAALSVASYFVDLTVGVNRLSRYVRLTVPVVLGLALFVLARDAAPERRRLVHAVAICVVAVLAFQSVFVLYASPLSNSASGGIPDGEVAGAQWVLDERGEETAIDELGTKHQRFHEFFERGEAYTGPGAGVETRPPPPQFDYWGGGPPTEAVGGEGGDQRYLVLTDLGRAEYPSFYPGYEEEWTYAPEDAERVADARETAHVYDNGGFDVYLVDDVRPVTALCQPSEPSENRR
ncbi:hypothetical protein [Halomarina ordinaria]|uniref:Glycosyltransferase RgtA/B/C/D-like domain-containing protein n=1 Tax=Halomarina ordinaria TaxID=3033939 RepID=A0ABD5UCE9_9EURY|nr:hypothetical protein [Halomarina sp. PSRA2]